MPKTARIIISAIGTMMNYNKISRNYSFCVLLKINFLALTADSYAMGKLAYC
jgi:hypothetical protein